MDIRILLIDDSEAQYYFVEALLLQNAETKFKLDWASTLAESMSLLEAHHYDVCLMDYDLGQVNALDILHMFREHNISAPVIVITGHGSHDIDLAVMKAGAVDFIEKPHLNAKNLERSLRYTIQQSRYTEILRQSEERFRLMVENASDLIIQVDGDGRFRYTSPSVTRCLRYSETELLGQLFVDYVFEEDLPDLVTMINVVTTDLEFPQNVQFRIIDKLGNPVWFECVATNLLHVAGVEAIVINGREITERRKLLETEKRQRIISNALLDTAITLNSTLNFDDVISRMLDNVANIIPHERANIILVDDEHSARVVVKSGYDNSVDLSVLLLDIRKFPTFQKMMETSAPLLINDVDNSDLWRVISDRLNCSCYLGAPIIAQDEIIGFINLEGMQVGMFQPNHINYLLVFSNLASTAITNARAYEHARELASVEERQRLARDLHDAVSQTLFSASVIADALSKSDLNNTDKIKRGLEKLTQLNRGALAEMRTLLMELRPQVVVNSPLGELVTNLSNSIKSHGLIDVELEVTGVSKIFAPDVQVQLYRLTQEVLNNVTKHSKAKLVNIVLRCRENAVEIAIADDGVGFATEEVSLNHHGMAIMHERANKIGAKLTIDSAPDEGTYVHIEWCDVVGSKL